MSARNEDARLLRVVAGNFVAGAIWDCRVHRWTRTALILLRWLHETNWTRFEASAKRRGWQLEWLG